MELDDRELKRLKELVPHKTLSPTPDEICEEIEKLHSIIKEAREYNEHLIRDAKYHLNEGHLKKMKKILDKVGETDVKD